MGIIRREEGIYFRPHYASKIYLRPIYRSRRSHTPCFTQSTWVKMRPLYASRPGHFMSKVTSGEFLAKQSKSLDSSFYSAYYVNKCLHSGPSGRSRPHRQAQRIVVNNCLYTPASQAGSKPVTRPLGYVNKCLYAPIYRPAANRLPLSKPGDNLPGLPARKGATQTNQ